MVEVQVGQADGRRGGGRDQAVPVAVMDDPPPGVVGGRPAALFSRGLLLRTAPDAFLDVAGSVGVSEVGLPDLLLVGGELVDDDVRMSMISPWRITPGCSGCMAGSVGREGGVNVPDSGAESVVGGRARVRRDGGGLMTEAVEERDGLLTQCPGRAHHVGDRQKRERDASPFGAYGARRGFSGVASPRPGHLVPPRARPCVSTRRLVCWCSHSSSTQVRMSAPPRVEPSSKWNSTGTEPCRARGP